MPDNYILEEDLDFKSHISNLWSLLFDRRILKMSTVMIVGACATAISTSVLVTFYASFLENEDLQTQLKASNMIMITYAIGLLIGGQFVGIVSTLRGFQGDRSVSQLSIVLHLLVYSSLAYCAY